MPYARYTTVAAVVLAFVFAAVVVRVAGAVVRRLVGALDIAGSDNRAAVQARARQILRALTLLAYGVAALAAVSIALSRFGVPEARWDPRLFARWFLDHGINVIVIIVGASIVIRAANLAIEHLQFKLGRRHASGDLAWQRRG